MKLNVFSLILVAALAFTACQSDSSDSADTNETNTETAVLDNASAEQAKLENTAEEVPSLPATTVEWDKKLHDFGDIPKGEKQKYVFKFTNTGDNPLVVSSATAGCGCTVPKKPEAPIAPGESGEIEVEYNGSGNGKISKNVTVLMNTETGKDILNISANVIAPEAQ